MDQLNSDSLFQSMHSSGSFHPLSDICVQSNRPNLDSRMETEATNPTAARKVQKADREKLRRDRLNEQFVELGNTLDPDRPKHDKASIIIDTIQMIKDLTSHVDKLKSEHAALTEESCELTLEKNDLREEKATLKSDIESLKAQCLQRVRPVYPWSGIEHSVVMHPSSYPYPVPVPIPTGPVPLQPFPYYGNQTPAVITNPCPTYVPYMTHNPVFEHQSTQQGTRDHASSKQDLKKNKSSDGVSRGDNCNDSNDIMTDLELKTPGSTSEQESSSKHRKAKKRIPRAMEPSFTDGSSSGTHSSTHSVQAISSNSNIVVGIKQVSHD